MLCKLDSCWPDSAVKRLQNKQQLVTKYPKFEFTQVCIIDLNTQEIYTYIFKNDIFQMLFKLLI